MQNNNQSENSFFSQKFDFSLSLLNCISDPIFIKDAKLCFIFVNDAFCQLIRRDRNEIIGKSAFEIYQDEIHKDSLINEEKLFITAKSMENEELITDSDGVAHYISTKKSIFIDGQKNQFLVAIVRDITDQYVLRKRYEDDARQERLRHVSADFDESADFESVCDRLVAEICDLGYLSSGQAYRVRPGLEGSWSLKPIGKPYIRAMVLGHLGFNPSPTNSGPLSAPQNSAEFYATLASENGILRSALGLGAPLWLEHFIRAQDPRAEKAYEAGFEAVIAVPLVIAGETVAVLEFFTAKGRGADGRLVQSLDEICQRAGLVLQRNATINRMRESEALKGAIISSSMDGLIVIDANGKVVEFNPGAERIFGFSRSEVIGAEIVHTIIPAHHADRHMNAMSNFLKGRLPQELRRRLEIDGRRKDGQIVPIELSITHIEASGRKLFSAYVRDLTEKKAAEQLIAQQQAKIVASSKMSELGTMAGGIAHEINNPLSVIQGKSQKLQALMNAGQIETNVLKKDLKMIEDTATRIAKIVKGLRAFARDGARDPLEVVFVNSIIEETLELCAARFRHHGISLNYEQNLTAKVECRPVQISQVLLNLLNNSFDSVQGQPSAWVEISVLEEIETIRLAVRDSGAGIPLGLRERVTAPFYTTKPVGKGTGLGLSICRAIIEDHGGKLLIDDVDSFMRISVLLPRRYIAGSEKQSA